MSLRFRVFIGAALWTVGLVLLSYVLIAWVLRTNPDMPFLGRQAVIHVVWVSHAGPIVILAACVMAAGAFQVRKGLSGVAQLRAKLVAVRDGRDPRLEGRYVPEVQPLVDDLNTLLEHRERAVRRAIAKAGDLAHGLKTPLAILATEAERAAADHPKLAAAIHQQVERMWRQVEYHLAHARAAASGASPGAVSVLRESADGLARTLAQLHRDSAVSIEVHVSPALAVRVQREDLDEMLGNLLDNACKWARSTVVIDARVVAGAVEITVDDDGAGIPPAMREAVLQRGVRADEQSAGSGLGLAIVRDLAEVYRGSIALEASNLGGLRVVLTLPEGGRLTRGTEAFEEAGPRDRPSLDVL
jgi:signal transduction histidine kinase